MNKENVVDILKNVTQKQIKVIALLEFVEDTLWTSEIIVGSKKEIIKGDTDEKTLDSVITKWKNWFEYTITSETWKDGKHFGSCTKAPTACFRCMCEEKLSVANKFIEYIKNGEYTSY